LVEEAAQFSDEDKRVKQRIESRTGLESYVYNLKRSIDDEDGVGGKIPKSDKEKLLDEIQDILEWMEQNPHAIKEDYDEKQKAIDKLAGPVMSRLYQSSGTPNTFEDDFGDHEL
jgi:heat shock protein 5